MKQVITLTTDFGDQFAVAQLHAVLVSLGFDGRVIENHSVSPFKIIEGAFELFQITKLIPDNSVHVGVVDPGVGSSRRGIVIKTQRSWFVGPDNGLLYPAAEKESIKQAWQLSESNISDEVSNTFHGRDIFIKAAVYITQGKQPKDFGSTSISPEALTQVNFQSGQILHIDHYGNIKIHWQENINAFRKLLIKTTKTAEVIPVVKTFSDVPPNTPLALLGSNGTLELAVNLTRGDEYFGVHLGEIVTIQSV